MLALEADANFPRPDALLAVVVLSDEEDCSMADPVGFFSGPESGRALNQRCVQRPEFLDPIDGIIASLAAGRDENQLLLLRWLVCPKTSVTPRCKRSWTTRAWSTN